MARHSEDLDDVIENLNEQEARQSKGNAPSSMAKAQIGTVEKYFSKLGVAAIALTGPLSVGDIIEIGTEENAIRQKVESMQIDRKEVSSADAGDSVGILVRCKVSDGEEVYKLSK